MNKMKLAWRIAEIGANRFGGGKSAYFQRSLEIVNDWAAAGCSEKVILNRILLNICSHVKQQMKISYWLDGCFFISRAESCKEIIDELEICIKEYASFRFQSIQMLNNGHWEKWGY